MRQCIIIVAFALSAFMIGCGRSAEPKGSEGSDVGAGSVAKPAGMELQFDALHLVAPSTWKSNRPAADYILAEFSLPRAEGDAFDGRLTVSIVGGSLRSNLDVWRHQFTKDRAQQVEPGSPQLHEEEPPSEFLKDREIAGIPVVFVDIEGTYYDRSSPEKPPEQHPGYRLLGAICGEAAEEHHLYIKFYGPAKTVAAHADEFRTFVRSMRVKRP